MSVTARRELAGKAKRSGIFVLLNRISSGLLRLASNVILAELLFPEAFGVMVLVNIFILGLNLFSDVGIGPSLVRSKRGEEAAFYNTAWTVQIARGLLLGLLCLVLAHPYAALFQKPEIIPLIMLAGLGPFAAGFRSPHWFTADRRQTLGRKVGLELFGQIVGIAAMVYWAWAYGTVVALVIGGIVQNAVISLASFFVLPGGRVRPQWDRAAASELYRFGRWIFASTAITFLAMQSDRLLLGGLLNGFWLGMIGLALGLLSICTHFVQGLSSSVVFPTWMNSQRLDPEAHLERMRRSRYALQCVAMAVLVGITAGTPALFRIFYDDRYQGAVPIVQMLCVATWFGTLSVTSTAAALVFGDSKATTRSNFLVFLFKIPLGLLGWWMLELVGFLLGVTLANLIGARALARSLRGHGLDVVKMDRDQSLLAVLYLELAILPMVFPFEGWTLLGVEFVWGAALLVACLWPARNFLGSMVKRA